MYEVRQGADQRGMAGVGQARQRALAKRLLRRRLKVSLARGRTSRALVDALFEHAPVGLAFVDTDLRYVRVNEAVAVFAGCSVDEYVGRTVREVHPSLADKIEPAMRRLIETGQPIVGEELSGELPSEPGRLRHFRISRYPVCDDRGALIGVGTVVDDVGELKQVEQRLEELLEREREAREQVEAAHSELAAANAQLAELALHDPLTGLANRRLFAEHLDAALARARRAGQGLAVVWLDLDDFKRVNDEHGHAAGDSLLQAVALRLRTTAREADLVARLGGDEFLVLLADLPRSATEASATIVVDGIVRSLAEPLVAAGAALRISASAGISLYPTDASSAAELLAHADVAMYGSKRAGSGQATIFTAESIG
jgi:diguanylate cyclase (GGDEF)-like protein/PAS domain S-box-containing protein